MLLTRLVIDSEIRSFVSGAAIDGIVAEIPMMVVNAMSCLDIGGRIFNDQVGVEVKFSGEHDITRFGFFLIVVAIDLPSRGANLASRRQRIQDDLAIAISDQGLFGLTYCVKVILVRASFDEGVTPRIVY